VKHKGKKMNVSKLVITPVCASAKKLTFKSPTVERAHTLITERLNSSTSFYNNNVPPKCPKWLKGLVNPKAYVGNDDYLKFL